MRDKTTAASWILRYSAAKLRYMITNDATPKPSSGMLQGVEYQEKASIPESLPEMRGSFPCKRSRWTVNFCIDEVRSKNISIEHKWLDPERVLEGWYLEVSLLQAAYYKAMIMQGATSLQTASFAVKAGHELVHMNINRKTKYYLNFGYQYYIIKMDMKGAKKITKYMGKKLSYAMTDYDRARAWDKRYYKKEYRDLKPYFKYKKCKEPCL